MKRYDPTPIRLTKRGETVLAWLSVLVLLAAMILPSGWLGVAW